MNYLPLIFLLSMVAGCSTEDLKVRDNNLFSIPFIVAPSLDDTLRLFKKDFMSDSWPRVTKKSRLSDTINLFMNEDRDTIFKNDFFYESYYDPLDSFGFDGLEIFADYQTSVLESEYISATGGNCYYPVFIVNQTPNTKLVMGKDSYIFAIQEAQDGDGRWRPVEHRGFDFCGNGKWGLKVHTDEFITVLFPKYEGSFTTKMRIRFKNGDIIYVSRPFDGIVNTNQFFIDTTANNFYEKRWKNSPREIQDMFYGSIPYELAE